MTCNKKRADHTIGACVARQYGSLFASSRNPGRVVDIRGHLELALDFLGFELRNAEILGDGMVALDDVLGSSSDEA